MTKSKTLINIFISEEGFQGVCRWTNFRQSIPALLHHLPVAIRDGHRCRRISNGAAAFNYVLDDFIFGGVTSLKIFWICERGTADIYLEWAS